MPGFLVVTGSTVIPSSAAGNTRRYTPAGTAGTQTQPP